MVPSNSLYVGILCYKNQLKSKDIHDFKLKPVVSIEIEREIMRILGVSATEFSYLKVNER